MCAKSSRNWTNAAVLAAAVTAARPALAQISYDLRYSDGSKHVSATPGNYTIDLWARITGTDTDHTNDKLVTSYAVVQSGSVSGGFGGGLSGAVTDNPFNGSGSRNGGVNNISADGINDWGGTGTQI